MRLLLRRLFSSFPKISLSRFTAAMASSEGKTAAIFNSLIFVVTILLFFPPAGSGWVKPEGSEVAKLKLYNSLTRQKVSRLLYSAMWSRMFPLMWREGGGVTLK